MIFDDNTTVPTRIPALGEQTLRQNLPLRPRGKLTDGNERDMKDPSSYTQKTDGRTTVAGDDGNVNFTPGTSDVIGNCVSIAGIFTSISQTGGDIYKSSGTITIHNTCPSPYSSNTPIQGS
ncbi:hypothetical protein TrRE_jg9339, partial [Triparma retinervis]